MALLRDEGNVEEHDRPHRFSLRSIEADSSGARRGASRLGWVAVDERGKREAEEDVRSFRWIAAEVNDAWIFQRGGWIASSDLS